LALTHKTQWVIWKPRKNQLNQEYNFLLLLSSNIVSMFADT
jgi:hypothetical protein